MTILRVPAQYHDLEVKPGDRIRLVAPTGLAILEVRVILHREPGGPGMYRVEIAELAPNRIHSIRGGTARQKVVLHIED